VIVRPAAARGKIATELEARAKRGNYRIHEDASLRKLVAYLNEYPSVNTRGFRSGLSELPDEILVTVMRDHQKYFAVEKKNGELAPHFLAVINVAKDSRESSAPATNASRARFADAQFFWSGSEMSARRYFAEARRVTYESRLAVIATRSSASAPSPAGSPNSGSISHVHAHVAEADRAAELAKCDSPPKWFASSLSFRASWAVL